MVFRSFTNYYTFSAYCVHYVHQIKSKKRFFKKNFILNNLNILHSKLLPTIIFPHVLLYS